MKVSISIKDTDGESVILEKEVDNQTWTEITRKVYIPALTAIGYHIPDDFFEYLDRRDEVVGNKEFVKNIFRMEDEKVICE